MRIAAIIFCVALLTACSQQVGSVTPGLGTAPNGLQHLSSAPAYRYLYGFKGGPGDGKWPAGRLVALDGTIYGAATEAGANGKGVVFAIDASGAERPIYNFAGNPDGNVPLGLTVLKGTLYGTTYAGGTHGQGTIFALSTAGTERVLYSFQGGADGSEPESIIAANGRLYGATPNGGTSNEGTVFSIDPVSGSKHVLYNFEGGSDGANPSGNLFAKGGVLYGTTATGGGTACYDVGCGTFFTMTFKGQKTTLYDFAGKPGDGEYPDGVRSFGNGVFYGITPFGGTHNAGTVYSIDTAGHEVVLHSFGSPDDGNDPTGVIAVGSKIYGTSGFGNTQTYVGTLFQIAKDGTFTVLHQFADDRHDGGVPSGGLVEMNRLLYGATAHGDPTGRGTIFTYAP